MPPLAVTLRLRLFTSITFAFNDFTGTGINTGPMREQRRNRSWHLGALLCAGNIYEYHYSVFVGTRAAIFDTFL